MGMGVNCLTIHSSLAQILPGSLYKLKHSFHTWGDGDFLLKLTHILSGRKAGTHTHTDTHIGTCTHTHTHKDTQALTGTHSGVFSSLDRPGLLSTPYMCPVPCFFRALALTLHLLRTDLCSLPGFADSVYLGSHPQNILSC